MLLSLFFSEFHQPEPEINALGMESQNIGATQIAISERGAAQNQYFPHTGRLNFVAPSSQYGCALIPDKTYLEVKLKINASCNLYYYNVGFLHLFF